MKKEVREQVNRFLEKQITETKYKIFKNKNEINKLVKEQEALKRLRGELNSLIKKVE
ncbi:MAG: hypothetical protein PHU86_03800 [Patescibacteria group bacterium]|nr:hypothetical protein [Patescibacteria group bacterium]